MPRLEERIQRLHVDVQKAGYRPMMPIERDLLSLSATIAYADRSSVRSSTRWERTIRLHLAVDSPDFWQAPIVKNTLVDCLRTLTGDLWSLEFAARRDCGPYPPQSQQLPWSDHCAVIPYSGGLDSLATFRLHNTLTSASPLAVPLNHRVGILSQIGDDRLVVNSLAAAKLHLGAGKHAETTFRTRSFLFLALAAVAARLQGVAKILVPETGQGALGAWMTAIGDEPPPCGSHPYFTHHFQAMLDILWPEDAPRIEHPNLWKTKAELLAEMREADACPENLDKIVTNSRSCSRSRADRIKGGNGRNCGLCPNCLLRRVSLVNGGFETVHREEAYIWKNLQAGDLAGVLAHDLPRFDVTPRHEEIARIAVIAHRDVARLAKRPDDPCVEEQAKILVNTLHIPLTTAKQELISLLARHQAEWFRFLDEETNEGSWVRAWCE
ncbi:MAG: hypothetical protein U1F76_31205 [Candidatus Competibacteraceae bacterium]